MGPGWSSTASLYLTVGSLDSFFGQTNQTSWFQANQLLPWSFWTFTRYTRCWNLSIKSSCVSGSFGNNHGFYLCFRLHLKPKCQPIVSHVKKKPWLFANALLSDPPWSHPNVLFPAAISHSKHRKSWTWSFCSASHAISPDSPRKRRRAAPPTAPPAPRLPHGVSGSNGWLSARWRGASWLDSRLAND